MLKYITGQALVQTETNINEKLLYTANTGNGLVSVANTNTDGTGTLQNILTANGASSGTLINTITIKAIGNTTRGMIRFFITDADLIVPPRLIDEVDVPAILQTATQESWSIILETNWYLKANWILSAATQNAESFIITAEALDYTYPTSLNGL